MRVGASRVRAITKPLDYENQYQEKLKIDEDFNNFTKNQLVSLQSTGLPQEAIQEAVAREGMAKFQTAMDILNQQFPFRNLASTQAIENTKSRVVSRSRAAPAKRRAPAKKRTTRKRKTKK